MALTAAQVISRVRDLLQDSAGTRWPDPTLLRFLNDGLRDIVSLRPEALQNTVIAQLAEGVRQELPTGYRRFVRMPRNLLAVTVPVTPTPAGLLVAESNGSTGVNLYQVTSGAVTFLCAIAYSSARVPASAQWLKFDAAPLGSNWYAVLSGDGLSYGGDLYKITSAGVATNQTADLGMTWTSALYGPNSIVASLDGLAVGMNQAPKFKFSANGSTWSDGVTLPTALTDGSLLAGSAGNLYDVALTGNAWKSTDGLNFTDTSMPAGVGVSPLATATFGDGGLLLIGGSGSNPNTMNWLTAAGAASSSITVNVGGTYVMAVGNNSRAFGYTPVSGVFASSRANILVRNADGQCAVARGTTLASFANGGGATVATVGSTGAFGYGCYDMGSGNYVVVLDSGIYRTTDFVTFSLAQAPTSYETFIGAGGWVPASVSVPGTWP